MFSSDLQNCETGNILGLKVLIIKYILIAKSRIICITHGWQIWILNESLAPSTGIPPWFPFLVFLVVLSPAHSTSLVPFLCLISSLWFQLWISALEKAMAPHSSTLAWKIPWMEEPGGLQSMGSLRVDTTERLHFHFHFSLSCIGEGNGNRLQCSCLENPRDGGAWWAAVYGVAQSRTRLKQLSSSSSTIEIKRNF